MKRERIEKHNDYEREEATGSVFRSGSAYLINDFPLPGVRTTKHSSDSLCTFREYEHSDKGRIAKLKSKLR